MEHDTSWLALIEGLTDEEDVDRAVDAAEALSELREEARVPQLYELLQHQSAFVRDAAAVPLAAIERVRCLPALLSALDRGKAEGHDNDRLRKAIWTVVADQEATAAVVTNLLRSDDPRQQRHGAWLAGMVADVLDIGVLTSHRASPSVGVRKAVALSIPSFAAKTDVIPWLRAMLRDEAATVRLAAVQSLGHVRDARAFDLVVSALEDEDPEVCSFAAHALEMQGDPRAADILTLRAQREREFTAVEEDNGFGFDDVEDTEPTA